MLVISIPCAFLVVVFEGFSMLCFLLITFIEDLKIDGMLVDHFKKKSKLRPSFFISKFINDRSLVITTPSGIDDAGY
jgi:hypothetical protein